MYGDDSVNRTNVSSVPVLNTILLRTKAAFMGSHLYYANITLPLDHHRYTTNTPIHRLEKTQV